MKTFMDTLAENLRAFTNSAAEKAGELTKAAAGKAEILSRIGRLKMDVFQLQREQNRYLAALGRIAFDELRGGKIKALTDRDEVSGLSEKIAELDMAIAENKQAVEKASQVADDGQTKVAETKPAAEGNGKAKASRTRKPSSRKTAKKED